MQMKKDEYSKENFTVINPPITFWLCITILGFFIILIIITTLFTPPPHTAMYVCVILFVFIPGIIISMWTKMFRIKVSGTTIHVRKSLGLIKFNINVSDITNVKWKITDTKFGRNEKIIIYTAKGQKIPLETIMINSNKMIKFIEKNVDKTKISKDYKKISSST